MHLEKSEEAMAASQENATNLGWGVFHFSNFVLNYRPSTIRYHLSQDIHTFPYHQ
jgi:hypothetical protein